MIDRERILELLPHRPPFLMVDRLIECDPGHSKTRARVLPTIPGEVPDLAALPEGCVFRDRCTDALPRCASEHPPLAACGAARTAACWLNETEAVA